MSSQDQLIKAVEVRDFLEVERLLLAEVKLDSGLMQLAAKSDARISSMISAKKQELNTSLMNAAKIGNTLDVQNSLNRGADPSFRDEDKWTALHWAVKNNHSNVAEILLQAGIKLDSDLMEMAAESDERITSMISVKLQELNRSLTNAAKNGNICEVQNVLNRGADPLLKDEDGWTALHWAVKNGHSDVVERLLKFEVKLDSNLMQVAAESDDSSGTITSKIEAKQQELNTSLMNAAKIGNTLDVQNSLNQGANSSFRDEDGWTALHWAVKNGHSDVVERLLRFEVKLDSSLKQMAAESNERITSMISVKLQELNTSLMNAAKNRNTCEMQNSLNQGADLSFIDEDGWTALHWAVKNNHSYMVKGLLRFEVILDSNLMQLAAKSDEIISSTISAKIQESFMNAAKNGNRHEVKNLLNQGADSLFRDKNGLTALHWAAKNNHIYVVETLLLAEVKLDSDLMQLAAKSDERISSMISVKLQELNTSLMNAAKNGNTCEMQNSLNRGADPSFRDEDGWTALHWAVKNGHSDVVERLLPDIVKLDSNLMEMAAESNEKITSMIGVKLQELNTSLMTAAKNGNTCEMQNSLNRGADPSFRDEDGWTALHWAVKNGHIDVIDQFVIFNGHKIIDYNIKTNDGFTPLYLSALGDKLWITNKLIDAGSDINATNGENKKTALHIAVQEGNTKIVYTLLQRKADTALLDNDGYSALHYAVLKGYTDVVDKFISTNANLNVLDKYGKSPLRIAKEKQHSQIIEKLLNAD